MKGFELDRTSKILYFATVSILLMGLCVVVAGPLFFNNTPIIEPVASGANTAPPSQQASGIIDPMLSFLEERAQIRDKERQTLNEILTDEDADQTLKADAGDRLLKLMSWIEQETTIEGVLRVRGFKDAVVTVHQDSANVLVRGDGLTRSESAQVLELVNRETGLLGGNIKIIPVG